MKLGNILPKILMVLCCALLVFGIVRLEKGAPFSKAESKLPASQMLLSDTDISYDKDKIEEMGNANISSGKGEETEEDRSQQDEDTEEKDNAQQEGDTRDEESPKEKTDASETEDDSVEPDGKNPGDSPVAEPSDGKPTFGPEELPDLPDIGGSGNGDKLPNELPSGNPGDIASGELELYFTTSIIDKDVVSNPKYTFTISHLKSELVVSGISVTLNGETETYRGLDKSFRLQLAEGSNTIIVKVIYFDGTDYITASRSYTLYCSGGSKVMIITDLDHIHEVSESKLTFTAYGLQGGKKLSASVRVNGKVVSGKKDTFSTELNFGENTITVTAGGRNDSVTNNYRVVYKENIFKITTTISDTVITNDTNQPNGKYEEHTINGDNETYKFKISVNAVTGKEGIKRVKLNSDVVAPGGDGWYTVELSQRTPKWLLLFYYDSEGVQHEYRFLLRFKRNAEATPEDKYPTIYAQVEVGDQVINLENGLTFKNPSIITNITAFSCSNEQLYYGNYVVKVNDQIIPQHSYQSGAWFGYDTYLTKEGENTITVTVTDYDGYAVRKTWRVYYEPGNVKIKVSVEATTVGLGYLIEPVEVEVPGGTSVMEIVTALLEQRGYTYETNGGSYLSCIYKSGICRDYRIDPELMELIQQDGMDATGSGYDPKPSSPDALGEFDFYRWSGWMYSYNGKYPGYGMNVCKPQDGAVIRVRFTLALGKDIGGYTSANAGYGQTPGNYYKEW